MNKKLFLLVSLAFLLGCSNYNSKNEIKKKDKLIETKTEAKNLLTDFIPIYPDGDINVVVEIPTGTIEKWEVDKANGQVKHEIKNNIPRIIQYIGYPGNYGMIPRTLLPKELGGDGDPLDVIVLGPPVERGNVVKCKIIGVLHLLDSGEQDDKLIAVLEDTPLYHVESLNELDENYIGISEIVKLWFINYKGPGKLESKGFGNKKTATTILNSAINEYSLKNKE